MERSVIRDSCTNCDAPDFAALHPGYKLSLHRLSAGTTRNGINPSTTLTSANTISQL